MLSFLFVGLVLFTASHAFADNEVIDLQSLIDEALANNPEIQASLARVSAVEHRIPQEKSLPDPMFMVGYQNAGFDQYTYGMMPDAMWMFSASQMFPFPTKLSTKGKMATSDFESAKKMHESLRLSVIARVKELYYDLFLAYKNLDLIKDSSMLFSKIEDAASARYSSGMAPQEELIMAQTEKYMLVEREQMLNQKIQATNAMLNATIGKDVNSPLGKPAKLEHTEFTYTLDDLLEMALEQSPEIKAKDEMTDSSESKVKMAKKEYLPDFTFSANYYERGDNFDDMWSITTSINIPIFFWKKQRQAVLEATEDFSAAKSDLEATKLMLSSAIKDNYSMLKTSEKLVDLYENGLIPKVRQDFDAALARYATGQVEEITVISRLKSLVDYELMYWTQLAEREKAIARIEALTGLGDKR